MDIDNQVNRLELNLLSLTFRIKRNKLELILLNLLDQESRNRSKLLYVYNVLWMCV